MIFVKKMEPWQYYANEMHTRWNFLAAWPPNQKLAIGDVGVLKGNIFTRKTSLDNLGVVYNKKTITGDITNEEFSSEGKVKVYSKFDASATPSALVKLGADIIVSFQKENAVYYKAPKSKVVSLNDQQSLGNTMVELCTKYREDIINGVKPGKEWQPDWAVITDLHFTERATVIISNKKDAYVGLNAMAGSTKTDILNLNCEIQASSSQGIETKIVAEKDLTPLFNVLTLEETIHKQLASKRYIHAPEPGEPGFKEYIKSLPTASYNVKKANFEPFVETPS